MSWDNGFGLGPCENIVLNLIKKEKEMEEISKRGMF